ncbi:MAG: DNA-protecting protein DprA [Pseudomonadota bacterium]|nr:DNA-protecting protein DprA [Pseudomonadota bacterium]
MALVPPDLPDRLALLRANAHPGKLLSLLAYFGTARAVLDADRETLRQFNIRNETIDAIKSPDLAGVERDLAWLENPGHQIICFDADSYPPQLKTIADPPWLLFAIGDTDYLQQPQLAMVGSRTPTAVGQRTAQEFARHLSNAGLTITSGLARGIDSACHQGALEGLAGTVAVVANGLNRIYPPSNRELARQIAQCGCLVTEAPVGTEPHKGLFPRRNRIISGLAIGTLVVEAAKESGSLITARLAMEQGREVFAIPGSIHNPLARGCHSLIRQGAKLVETADDILEELAMLVNLNLSRHTTAPNQGAIHQPAVAAPDASYQRLLDCMEYEPVSIDELVERSQLKAADIASMLLILELQGTVVSRSGQYARMR